MVAFILWYSTLSLLNWCNLWQICQRNPLTLFICVCCGLTWPGPLYSQRVESAGQPPLFSAQGSTGTQTFPSPSYPCLHLHSKRPAFTEQSAFLSQEPGTHTPVDRHKYQMLIPLNLTLRGWVGWRRCSGNNYKDWTWILADRTACGLFKSSFTGYSCFYLLMLL